MGSEGERMGSGDERMGSGGWRMGSEGDLRVRLEIRASGYRMSCYLVWLLYVLINYPNCLLT